jgi:hypothetical protein
MGRFCSRGLWSAITLAFLLAFAACGGGTKAGPPLFPGKVNLTPATNTSIVQGSTIVFTASAQTQSGTNLNVPISFSSSDTSVLNISANGVACGGQWNATFSSCTPGNSGVATVTATALGQASVPTYVFVHPPIDNITVTGVLLEGVPVQEPCLSQSQTMTLEAHAFSKGIDVTSSVGPFTFTSSNTGVATLVPLPNNAYNFATNQATATASTPGITQIIATASGVSSKTFQQPQYSNPQGNSPVLDFFATCPVQNIALELGAAGSGQTSFATAKGTAEKVVATVTDIMGNSTLPNTNGGVVLSKVPLTWTSSRPGALSTGTTCQETCSITTSPGAATITASCSPPTCNVGFPQIPASLATQTQIDACTQFFQANAPSTFSCQQLIPMPVYASPVLITSGGSTPLTPATGAIGGVVTGASSAASVFASSTGCANLPPSTCSSAAYLLSTAKASTGGENPLPASPNSFLFNPQGDKVYMGSDFGAVMITTANLNSANNPYTSFGTVTGKALAVSNSGTNVVFSDTIHTPNQVYVVNAANSAGIVSTPLNISGATTAAFSPDGLKTYIVGGTNSSSLYVYSTLQALQQPSTSPQLALSGPASAVGFSPNGAFAFVAEGAGTGSPNVTAFSTCNNQVAASVTLPADPILMKVLPNVHLDGKDSFGNSIPDGVHVLVLDSTGFDLITATISAPANGTLCPQGLTFISGDPLRTTQRIELGEGTLQPVNFFASADGTQLYVANASSANIFVYNLIIGSVTGSISILNNATPISAEMTTDAATIIIAGNDGMLHELTTVLGGSDNVQLSFPNLPNYLNPFCTVYPTTGACVLNVAITKQ